MLIKIWRVNTPAAATTYLESGSINGRPGEFAACPITVQCITILNLQKQAPHNFVLDNHIGVNPRRLTLAIPSNGGIVVASYARDGIVNKKSTLSHCINQMICLKPL
jgi:hypothetical protein